MIGITYTCGRCHVIQRVVNVTPRTALQDVAQWVEGTLAVALSEDHRKTSPLCTATKMKTVKIPLSDGVGVGMLNDQRIKG